MLHRHPLSRRSPRRGTVVLLVAVCLVALFGVAAIALDGGVQLDYRRRSQAGADAAAMAAACDLYLRNTIATAKASALTTAALCGFSNDGSTNTVVVNIPPLSGNFAGNAYCAEVIVTFYQGRTFSSIFGSANLTVSARAVGAISSVPYDNNGVICLDPTAQKALNITGSGNVTVTSGAVIVDSNSPDAAVLTGNGSLIASQILITGTKPGDNDTGSGTFKTTPTPGNLQTGVPPTADPLASLPAPVATDYGIQNSGGTLNINHDTTLQPGRYVGGINVSGGNVTLMPGIYYMDHGGFSQSNGTITGAGVMIYNDPTPGSGQKVSVSGGTFDITAPTSGTYQGMVVFQARDANNVPMSITGPSGSTMLGCVYAPSSPVQITGGGAVAIGSEFICDTLTVTGPGSFGVGYSGSPRPAKQSVRLVE